VADAGVARSLALSDIRRLTLDTGCDEFPSLTPDARVVVYDAVFGEDEHLVALDLATGKRRVLTNDPGWQIAPSVSPDGTRVAFLVMHGQQKGAYVLPLDGSAPPRFLHKGQARPSWSPDGRALWTGGAEGSERIDVETGAVTRRLQPPPATLLSQTRELPDGRVFALLYDRELHAFTTIVRFDAGGGAPTTLYKADLLEEAFALDPDGTRIFFTKALPTQHAELWQLPLDGSPATVADRTMEATRGLVLANGKAAWSRCEALQRTTTLSRSPDGGALRAQQAPDTEWADERPAGVPSSATQMVVVSDRSAAKEIWLVDVERPSDARRLDTEGLTPAQPAVTSDGRSVAFAVEGQGIYAMSIDPKGRPRRLTHGADDGDPTFSADGLTVYFETAGIRRGRAIAAVSMEGGDPKAVVPNGRHPFVSPASGRLAYVSDEGEDTGEPRLWDARMMTSAPLSKALPRGSYSALRISPDGQWIAVFAGTGEIIEVAAATGAVSGRYKTADEFLGMTYLGDHLVVSALTFGGQIWGASTRSP
jgi:Tol biopolymer transport system component